MTESEFTAHYQEVYPKLLHYAVTRTDDFFLAEEAVSQVLLEQWQAGSRFSITTAKQLVAKRIVDFWRKKARIMCYVRVDEERTTPLSLELDHELHSDSLAERTPTTRPLEDIVLDIIDIKEAFEENPAMVLERLELNKPRTSEPEHGTHKMYTYYKCRCEPCRFANSEYQRQRYANGWRRKSRRKVAA